LEITAAGGELPDLTSANIVKTHRTVTAEGKAGNFVFIGRGWGHGVGLSQYGAKSLAELGYDYKTILTTYLPGTSPVNYRTILNTDVK
jgi:stage II sporulation protein D